MTAEPSPDNMYCKLEKMTELTMQQETPIRVLYRRSNAIREKVVHNMKVEREGLKDNMFKLLVSTSAGTYVKEFVHEDFSCTVPNVGSLLDCRADILALDVEKVELAWPPGGKGASA